MSETVEPFDIDMTHGLCSVALDGGEVVISLLNGGGERVTLSLLHEDAQQLAVAIRSLSGGRLRNAWRRMVGKR